MEFTEEQKKRFWNKVDKTDSCWLWTGGTSGGYGQVKINNKMYRAHRVSWFLAGNTIPEGHVVRHKCRNRHCVNPEHIETGTYAENNGIDRVRDGTCASGEKQGHAKLTEAQVLEIRERATENQYRLAEEYGVSQGAVWLIIQRRNWKHI